MPIHDIDITLESDLWLKNHPDIENTSEKIVSKTLDLLIQNIPHIEVSVVLADNDFLQNLNKKFRGIDKPTNVLSFPIADEEILIAPAPFLSLGDIIVSYETIKQEAEEQGKLLIDHYIHMLVHGCLHLLHYDHETDEEAEEMEDLEVEILDRMNIKNPYETN